MGQYCPYCHTRVSHTWHNTYVFCSDTCRHQFIIVQLKKKIPHDFGDSKNQRQDKRRRREEWRLKYEKSNKS